MGTKLIDIVWAMKKKSTGTLRGQMNGSGFKQIEGQHYNGTTISSPVTNAATIRIALMLMIMVSMLAHVVDVREAFLHGEFNLRIEKSYILKLCRASRSIFLRGVSYY